MYVATHATTPSSARRLAMGANCHFSPTAQTPPWTKRATGRPSEAVSSGFELEGEAAAAAAAAFDGRFRSARRGGDAAALGTASSRATPAGRYTSMTARGASA